MKFFVFDVESVGLHGEGFAYGYTVVDENLTELDWRQGVVSFDFWNASDPLRSDIAWVTANVLPSLPEPNFASIPELRQDFWNGLQKWMAEGALVFADCSWPVEARFLRDCFQDAQRNADTRYGPYPLHDIATVFLCAGMDPTGTYPRLPQEMPAHNPLNDARQSARLLVECLPPVPRFFGLEAGGDK